MRWVRSVKRPRTVSWYTMIPEAVSDLLEGDVLVVAGLTQEVQFAKPPSLELSERDCIQPPG